MTVVVFHAIVRFLDYWAVLILGSAFLPRQAGLPCCASSDEDTRVGTLLAVDRGFSDLSRLIVVP